MQGIISTALEKLQAIVSTQSNNRIEAAIVELDWKNPNTWHNNSKNQEPFVLLTFNNYNRFNEIRFPKDLNKFRQELYQNYTETTYFIPFTYDSGDVIGPDPDEKLREMFERVDESQDEWEEFSKYATRDAGNIRSLKIIIKDCLTEFFTINYLLKKANHPNSSEVTEKLLEIVFADLPNNKLYLLLWGMISEQDHGRDIRNALFKDESFLEMLDMRLEEISLRDIDEDFFEIFNDSPVTCISKSLAKHFDSEEMSTVLKEDTEIDDFTPGKTEEITAFYLCDLAKRSGVLPKLIHAALHYNDKRGKALQDTLMEDEKFSEIFKRSLRASKDYFSKEKLRYHFEKIDDTQAKDLRGIILKILKIRRPRKVKDLLHESGIEKIPTAEEVRADIYIEKNVTHHKLVTIIQQIVKDYEEQSAQDSDGERKLREYLQEELRSMINDWLSHKT
jgi:hypothetical protein